jgi:hypothetical protein
LASYGARGDTGRRRLVATDEGGVLSAMEYCILGGVDRRARDVAKKAKKRVFSVVKAVKENARARVGTVPAEKILPDPKAKEERKPKHKETLGDLLEKAAGE